MAISLALLHGQRLTLAVVEVEPGAVLPEHRHDNEQFGMVVQGSVIFRVGSEERSLSAGGIWRIPPDTPHTMSPPVTLCGVVIEHLLSGARRLDGSRAADAASTVLAVIRHRSLPSLLNATPRNASLPTTRSSHAPGLVSVP